MHRLRAQSIGVLGYLADRCRLIGLALTLPKPDVPCVEKHMHDQPDPGKILQTGLAFWASKTLLSAVELGVFTDKPGTLNNAFFVNLLDMSTQWSKSTSAEGVYEGRDRASGELKWKASPVDLIFGSSSELRAVAEVYAQDAAQEKFVRDFVAAWSKVMMLDRFDVL